MKFEKKHLIHLLIGLVATVLIFGLYLKTRIIDSLELKSLNGMFEMRNERSIAVGGIVKPNPRLNENVIIIGIDEKAINKFGRFPWPRSVYAQFLNKLREGHPAGIFFDIFFTEYSTPAEDGPFFTALAQNRDRNIFFDFPFEKKGEAIDVKTIKEKLDLLNRQSFEMNSTARGLSPYNYGAIPVAEIQRNAKGTGHAVIEPDSDDTFRKLPLVVKFNNKLYPQVVFLMALNYLQVPLKNVEFKIGEYVLLKDAKVPMKDQSGTITGYKTQNIKIPVDTEGKMLINYVGYPGEFIAQSQYLSFAEVFDVPAEYFNNKVLFFGMYAQGIAHDIWNSPHGTMYGIEHNANAFNSIIQRDFLQNTPPGMNFLISLFFGLLIAFLVPRVKIWQSIIVILLILIGLFITVFFYVFPNYNRILLFIVPLLTIVLSFIGTLLYRILTEEKEKKFIKSRFAKYVSSSVVDELLKNPKALQLGGEDRFITVMFSDVRGFTTISEQLGEPQKLVALLNEYLTAMTEIIFKFDGTLDKYVGDEVMAFWGAPVPQEDHAYRACKASLAQIKYLHEVLQPKWDSEKKPKLNIGIGLNTGNMTVGNMGSHSRMDYTLMGDNVNLGARLEGTNKVYSTVIIISEFTYEQVKDKVIVRELDLIKVKGKTKPVRIYELMDLKDEDVILPKIELKE